MLSMTLARRRFLSIFFLLGMALLGGASIPVARAQDAAPAEAAAADPAPEAAPEAAAPAAPRPAAPPTEPEQSVVVWYFYTIGLIGLGIHLVMIYFIAVVGRMFVELRPQVVMPPELVDELENLLQARQFKEIYGVVKEDHSYYGRVITTGIAELPNGLAEARDAMERVGESLTVEMEKKISIFAVLGTLGPMIGLLGTLKGMIASFGAIARSGAQLKADEVAKGISEALLLTFLGVILSVPAIYFFALFRNRVTMMSVNTMLAADDFLRRFAHAARAKAAPAAAAAAAAQRPAPKPS